jgi:hypothetical protein
MLPGGHLIDDLRDFARDTHRLGPFGHEGSQTGKDSAAAASEWSDPDPLHHLIHPEKQRDIVGVILEDPGLAEQFDKTG